MQNQQLIKGCLSAIILKLLDENGQMYGYEMTQKVKAITANEIQITEGALYPTLHKLEAEGILTTKTTMVDGRTRKYYSITPQGQPEAQSRMADLANFAQQLQQLLNPKLTPLRL
jgi:PadR family transcriptional regulator, regulatory protein PadR